MSNFTAHTNYTNRKRWLLCQFGPVQARMYWYPVGVPGRGLSPRIEILWSNPRGYSMRDLCCFAKVVLNDPTRHSSSITYEWYERHVHDSWAGRRGVEQLTPPPDIPDLLSIACNVAARRCDKGILWDWIMEKWPTPFSYLCSDDPVACIRALCPMRLAGE